MITNFEEITENLTEFEINTLVPELMKGFAKRSEINPIKDPEIVTGMRKNYQKFNQVVLRKCVNYIRSNSLMPLIATSRGYFITDDADVINKQIKSLQERARSIERCAIGLSEFLL